MESQLVLIGQTLASYGQTVATAESCTGGMIAAALTSLPGSSVWFGYGIVSYSNKAKQTLLGVQPETLATYGAVSERVVRQMAEGVKRVAQADWAIAVSGIAGPDGGSPEKPVGTVWLALARPDGGTEVWKCRWDGDRAAVREQTAKEALCRLGERLQQQHIVS